MKKPAFWDKKGTVWERMFKPLGALYAYSVRRRFERSLPYQPVVPVICVGNIAVGGTGKTPVCLALAEWFQRHGYRVVFLNHGYKSRLQNIVVDMAHHTARDVSDEALLLAEQAPTVVDRNRGRGVATAEKMGADVIIMDDGFQNPSVIKTMSLLVFDGAKGIGNGACLPAGPLREPLAQGLKRADAVVMVGADQTGLTEQIQSMVPQMPVLSGVLKPVQLMQHPVSRAIAFAGIGRPEKFFNMLRTYGVTLEATYVFDDHHAYQASDLKSILAYDGPILTTGKDAVKLWPAALEKITVVSAPFVFENEPMWDAFLKKGIQ